MLDAIIKRTEKILDSHPLGEEEAEEEKEEGKHSQQDDLLIAVVVLSIFVCILFLVVVYGYWKYVRGRGKEKTTGEMENNEKRERSSNMREKPEEDIEQPPIEPPVHSVPVKLRKRSMTFSETDEECRKYREDLADSFVKTEAPERSRKKSVVTFVGVEEIDP